LENKLFYEFFDQNLRRFVIISAGKLSEGEFTILNY